MEEEQYGIHTILLLRAEAEYLEVSMHTNWYYGWLTFESDNSDCISSSVGNIQDGCCDLLEDKS